jgi:hypothetical protein
MSAYNESTSSAGLFNQLPSTLAFNNLVSSPGTSRSGLESDGILAHRNLRNGTNSTCPETNVARYAESLNEPLRGNIDEEIFEIDHSVGIGKDIGLFFNDNRLNDFTIKVKKTLTPVVCPAIFVSDSLQPYEEKTDAGFEVFRVHKVILAARCPYFNTLFCSHSWKDSGKDHHESKFEDFEPECMRIFLQYVYTGKLKIHLRTLIGVLRVASYFNMSIIMDSCKNILDSDYFTALDLCQLYKETRTHDFDGMCSHLSELIPKRTCNESICKILKEIWQEHESEDDSEDEICPNIKDESRSMKIRSTRSELYVKHAMSQNQEAMTELLSDSEDKSLNEEDHEDLPLKLLRIIQKRLPDLYEKEETMDDLIRLPQSALRTLFKSDRSCASEMMFFNILAKTIVVNPTVLKQTSIDSIQNDEHNVIINELEEEKSECQSQELNTTSLNKSPTTAELRQDTLITNSDSFQPSDKECLQNELKSLAKSSDFSAFSPNFANKSVQNR